MSADQRASRLIRVTTVKFDPSVKDQLKTLTALGIISGVRFYDEFSYHMTDGTVGKFIFFDNDRHIIENGFNGITCRDERFSEVRQKALDRIIKSLKAPIHRDAKFLFEWAIEHEVSFDSDVLIDAGKKDVNRVLEFSKGNYTYSIKSCAPLSMNSYYHLIHLYRQAAFVIKQSAKLDKFSSDDNVVEVGISVRSSADRLTFGDSEYSIEVIGGTKYVLRGNSLEKVIAEVLV